MLRALARPVQRSLQRGQGVAAAKVRCGGRRASSIDQGGGRCPWVFVLGTRRDATLTPRPLPTPPHQPHQQQQQQQQKRKMSGLVEKNYFVEEWNGRREITEKTFKFNGKTVPSLIGLVVIFPGFIYFVMKDELAKKYEKLGYNTKKGGDRDMM